MGAVIGDTWRVDERLNSINADVAAAADAWLKDPLDAGIYGRLVAAVAERKMVLRPTGATPVSTIEVPMVETAEPDEVMLTDEDHGSVRPVSDLLSGDPRAALERLRRGAR